jgi:hypothetical protein
MPDYDPADRAREAYEVAYERVLLVWKEWVKAGRPLVVTFSIGVAATDPLLKTLRELELDAAKRLAEARIKHRGPTPRAVVQADIGESPAAKLRALN